MKDNIMSIALLEAVERGYMVDAKGIAHNKHGDAINGCLCTTGYKYITIRMDKYFGRRKCCKVFIHRIMAYQKFGDKIFDECLEVRHLNNNKLDNSWGNVSIGTPSENRYDLDEKTRLRTSKIAAKAQRKFTDDEIISMRLKHKNGLSYKKIMDEYKIAKSTLSYIINGNTYNETGTAL